LSGLQAIHDLETERGEMRGTYDVAITLGVFAAVLLLIGAGCWLVWRSEK
jgi:flagellar biogenesis protein FliO